MIEVSDMPVHPVHPALRPYLRAIRIEKSAGEVGAYHVLPGPVPVAGFQARGRLCVLRQGREQLLDVCGITGLQSTARTFLPQADTHTVLVVFEPFGAFAVLGCPMNEIVEEHIGFGAILPARRCRDVSDRLREARTNREMAEIVESFLLTLLERRRPRPHALVLEAVRQITDCRGGERIENLADDLGVSRRHLERLFQLQIGVGPKEFASLTRFNWLMSQLPHRRSWAALAYEAGFADQAHFVRHFVARTGVPPEDYLRSLHSA
jgi:methylphosphotriester-DNA--protein-cysteine methyltransferase